MNPEPEVLHVQYTLLDLIQMSGSHGIFAAQAALVLWIVGVVFVFVRPNVRLRSAYLMACVLPGLSGITGLATGMMSAFATLGVAGVGDGFKFFAALGEIVLPMMFGFIGSGIALMIGALVWVRAVKDAPPRLPN